VRAEHFVRSSPLRRLCLVAMLTGLGGCSTASWQQLFYDVGDNYACQQAGAHQRDAQARASQCADSQHPDRSRYQDYQAARAKTLDEQP